MKELAAEQREDASVFVGVDTHSEAHVAVALNGVGRRIGELRVPNSETGYAELLGWVLGLGRPVAAGVEGTGSYGSGLSRFLQIEQLVKEAAPELVSLDGVGPDTAATLLIAAGDNPQRLRSEASFAHLCGAAPVRASSGKVVRHRLNPGGNRDANRALHVVVLNRMRRDPRTQEYVARRTAEGKSKKEAMRCLKRYIARETYRAILLDAEAGAHISPS